MDVLLIWDCPECGERHMKSISYDGSAYRVLVLICSECKFTDKITLVTKTNNRMGRNG